jgi:hypothetical protein
MMQAGSRQGEPTFHISTAWLGGLLALVACNPLKFKECRDHMTLSQQVLLDMDDQDIDEVQKSLTAVQSTIGACDGVVGDTDVAKLKDAEGKLTKQLSGLRARAAPKARPQLSAAELARLKDSGDPDCPRGQEYEHPQNKQRIRCTGPQVIEMNEAQAIHQFNERRGFTVHPQGTTLRFESGAEVVEFSFKEAHSAAAAQCVTITGEPGIAWQELVARATGVQPRTMKLGQPIATSRGPLALLVEGGGEQFVVKLGSCPSTPGQKPYAEPSAAPAVSSH